MPDQSNFHFGGSSDPAWIFQQFRRATLDGNEAFSEGAVWRALELFEDALKLATKFFDQAVDGLCCPECACSALLVANQNIAQVLCRFGRFQEAERHLESVCCTLGEWQSSPKAEPRFRHACKKLLPDAVEGYIAHLERCGIEHVGHFGFPRTVH